jgi:hypothetical protein
MIKKFCILNIEQDKEPNIKPLLKILPELRVGKYEVEFKHITKRSLNSNKYYWLIMDRYVQPALYDAGWNDIKNKDAAHEFVKSLFLKTKFTNESSGEVVERIRSTTELTKAEFNEYLEDIKMWAAQYLGVAIPDPNQQFVLYE